jgi:type III pantothenate kinase
MLLAIDIGNTNITLGLFSENKLLQKWRLTTDNAKSSDTYAVDIVELFLNSSIDCLKTTNVIIASVVPKLTGVIEEAVKKFYNDKVLIVGDKSLKLGIENKLKNKSEVGADRLINGIAGYRKFGGDLIIVDFGTATTFDVIGGSGEYLGGVIAPGINLSIKALHDMTAQLPRIKVKKQDNVIGKSTIEAMNSGIYFGYISLTEGLIKRIKSEYKKPMKVITTGGLAHLFENVISEVNHIEPDLTLEGLKIVCEENAV